MDVTGHNGTMNNEWVDNLMAEDNVMYFSP